MQNIKIAIMIVIVSLFQIIIYSFHMHFRETGNLYTRAAYWILVIAEFFLIPIFFIFLV